MFRRRPDRFDEVADSEGHVKYDEAVVSRLDLNGPGPVDEMQCTAIAFHAIRATGKAQTRIADFSNRHYGFSGNRRVPSSVRSTELRQSEHPAEG